MRAGRVPTLLIMSDAPKTETPATEAAPKSTPQPGLKLGQRVVHTPSGTVGTIVGLAHHGNEPSTANVSLDLASLTWLTDKHVTAIVAEYSLDDLQSAPSKTS